MATIEQLLSQLESDKDTLVTNLNSKGVIANNTETFTTLVPKVLNITSEGIAPDKTIQSGDYEYIETMEISPSNDIGFHVISFPTDKSVFFEAGAGYEMNVSNTDMAAYLQLTPDKLVSGYSILGIDGTAINLDTSDANATSEQILEGYTAYVNGEKVEGKILKKTESTITPGTVDVTISRGIYLDGTQTIKGDEALISDNIKAGTTIFNVPGKDTVVDTEVNVADGAINSEILSGKEAFVNGVKVVGVVESLSSNGQVIQSAQIEYEDTAINIGLSNTYTTPKFIKAEDKIIYQVPKENLAQTIGLSSDVIKKNVEILGITGTYEGSGGGTHEEQILLDCRTMTSAEQVAEAYANEIMTATGDLSFFSPIQVTEYKIIGAGYLQNTAGVNFRVETVPSGFYFKTPVNITSNTNLLNVIFYVSTWINPKLKIHFVDGNTEEEIQQNISNGTYVYTQEVVFSNSRNNAFDLIRLDSIPLGSHYIFVEIDTNPGGNENILNYLSIVEL